MLGKPAWARLHVARCSQSSQFQTELIVIIFQLNCLPVCHWQWNRAPGQSLGQEQVQHQPRLAGSRLKQKALSQLAMLAAAKRMASQCWRPLFRADPSRAMSLRQHHQDNVARLGRASSAWRDPPSWSLSFDRSPEVMPRAIFLLGAGACSRERGTDD
jgi:hypothetical protein